MADEIDLVTDAILEAPGIRAAAIRESLLGEGKDEFEDCASTWTAWKERNK